MRQSFAPRDIPNSTPAPVWLAVTFAFMLALTFGTPGLAAAQQISGTVTDTLNRPLAQAKLELSNQNGVAVAHTTTDQTGRFTIGSAKTGIYSLAVSKAGFKSANKIIHVRRNAAETISLSLEAKTALKVPVQASLLRAPNGVSSTGAVKYTVTAQDISNLPQGENTNITDVLTQMPGVAIDQNQQIHIRNTEGPQFQYQINGVLVPLDINTNPPFLSMINPQFVKRLDLLDGVLPARYSYATGGVVDIQTKDGCAEPGGSVTMLVAQRQTLQPSAQLAG